MQDVAETNPRKPLYPRVLLKISGEALMGDQGFGLHPPTMARIAGEVKKAHDLGIQICMVIGGGNIFRGLAGAAQGMERAQADYMGMLATVMNALGMQSALEEAGVNTRVLSAIPRNSGSCISRWATPSWRAEVTTRIGTTAKRPMWLSAWRWNFATRLSRARS